MAARLLRRFAPRNDEPFPLIVRSGMVEGGADPWRRHRQFGEPAVDGTVDRIGDRRHRRDDVDLADPLGAVGCAGFGTSTSTASIIGMSGATGTR